MGKSFTKRTAALRPSVAPPIQTEIRAISELKVNPQNPRIHSPQQIRRLAENIEIFGFLVPLLIDASDQIIAGHARKLACELLGITHVPTIAVKHLSSVQVQALLIAENRLSQLSRWDEKLLAQQIKSLAEVELDFNLEAIGFEMAEIDLMVQALNSEADDENDDFLAENIDLPVISQYGDEWLLGPHRIKVGNSLDAATFNMLMRGEKAAMIFVDHPYNVPVKGHIGGRGGVQHKDFQMASGEMSTTEFTNFLIQSFSLLAAHSKDGALHFICSDWRHLREFITAGEGVYSEQKNLIVWTKTNGGMGSMYRSAHELIFLYKNGSAPHRNNIQLGRYGRYRTNVWQYPGMNSFARKTPEGDLLALHPTIKPTGLIAEAILDCTARKDLVLDSFLGSGSTLLAAELTGRVCFGIDIEPRYIDVSVRRWQAKTGKDAIHGSSGKTFAELERGVCNVQ
jgi:DNA modification methylase